jgi:PEP-CTERM motif
MHIKSRLASFLVMAGLAPACFGGTVIYSNFDSTDDTYSSTGERAQGPSAPSSPAAFSSPAFEFQASQTATVTQIDVALTDLASILDGFGASSTASLELFTDNSDSVGTEIGGPYSITALNSSTTNPYDTVVVTGGPVLTAGANYWLAIVPNASSLLVWHQQESPSLVSSFAQDATGGGVYTTGGNIGPGGFDVMGTATAPEPASFLLIGTAMAGLGVRRFRKGRR